MPLLTLEVIIIDDPKPCEIDRAVKGEPLRTFVRTVRGEVWPVRFGAFTHFSAVPASGQADGWSLRQREVAVQNLSHLAARMHPPIALQLLPWRLSLDLWEAGKFAHVGIPWPTLP